MTIPDRIGTEEKAMDYNDLKKNGLIRALDHNPDTKKAPNSLSYGLFLWFRELDLFKILQ